MLRCIIDRQTVELDSVTLGLYDAVIFQTSGVAAVVASLSLLLASMFAILTM